MVASQVANLDVKKSERISVIGSESQLGARFFIEKYHKRHESAKFVRFCHYDPFMVSPKESLLHCVHTELLKREKKKAGGERSDGLYLSFRTSFAWGGHDNRAAYGR